MPFGLTNAPATFQRLMECVLAALIDEQCLIYLDDIVVFSKTFQEHLQHLTNVFHALESAGLKLKASKCHFAKREINYLGHIVSAKGIHPDSAKVEAVSLYPIPKDVKEQLQFLGLTNYYHPFVANYSKIAEPLHKLLRKGADFQWDSNCQKAFDDLKHRLVSPPILAFQDFSRQFILYMAIGAVLSQSQNGQEQVISYWGRQLQKAERNYSTIEREALAEVSAVKEFYPYLYGFIFKLVTDHNPLTSLKGLKDVGECLVKWMIFLQQFNFQMEYRPGKNNSNAVVMSRRPSTDEVVALIQDLNTDMDALKENQLSDVQLAPVVEALKGGRPPPTDSAPGLRRVFLQDGILCQKFRESSSAAANIQLVIPDNMKNIVLQQLHDYAGHLGVRGTTENVKERFYWPGYESDIEKWVRECQLCQKCKPPQPVPQAPLGTIKANHPFEKTWDIMGPLPANSKGMKYILVVTDIFSKWVEAFPIRATDTETLATILVDEIVCRYGVPSTLHSDRGANLTSKVISALCECLGIRRTQTTAYHTQGNGPVERFNRTLEAMLSR